jgi:hypothetical protein
MYSFDASASPGEGNSNGENNQTAVAVAKSYSQPCLVHYGDFNGLTKGGPFSGGSETSGAPLTAC